MRSPSKRCSNCGALLLRPGSQGACDYCGAGVAIAEPAVGFEAPAPTRAQRFASLKAQPDYPSLLRQPVGDDGYLAGATFGLVVLGALIVVLVLTATASRMDGKRTGAFLVIGIAVFAFFRVLRGRARFAGDRGRAKPAYVVEERTRGKDGKTRHFALLEDEHGDRAELETSSEVAGRIAAGDFGVAYERGGRLVHFARVRV